MTVTTRRKRIGRTKAVHARAHTLGLDERVRRGTQDRATGQASRRDMNAAELHAVIAAMDRRAGAGTGRRPRPDHQRLPDGPHRNTLWVLWQLGWHLGVVDNPGEAALIAFIRGPTGLDTDRWASDERETAKAVARLKAWLAHEACVVWPPHVTAEGKGLDNSRAWVLAAQWHILAGLGVARIDNPGALASYAARHAGTARKISHTDLTDDQADALIWHLGQRIRKAKTENGSTYRGPT